MNRFKVGDIVERTGGHWLDMDTGDRGRVCAVDSHTGAVALDGFEGTHSPESLRLHLPAEQAHPKPPEADPVNRPSHYTSDPSGVECIQITRHRNFNIGNAFKYLWRNGLKDDAALSARQKQVQDLRKSVYYIEDEIKRLESL